MKSEKKECHGGANTLHVTLPPLSVIYLKRV
jgi:hypothetical protein